MLLRSFVSLFTAVVLLAACATAPAPTTAVRVDVLATGFLVDNTVLATSEELRAFLSDARARDVQLYATKDIPFDRVERTAIVIRDTGATVAILVAPTPPPPAR